MPGPDGELLRTARLRLRAWTTSPADVARLGDIYGREEVTRWIGGPPTVPAAELPARWAAVHAADARFGCWAVEREDGVPAGTVLFKPLPNGVGEVEVGWHLHPDSWGHGYATEAARAVVERGFEDGLPEVYAVVRPGNTASLAVCRRLGMTPLGRMRRWYDVELEAFRLMAPAVVVGTDHLPGRTAPRWTG
jgi:RimJ/RimL family protein N-acetyltransferase